MEEITKLEEVLLWINTISGFSLPLICIIFFKKEDLKLVKKLKVLLFISIFLCTTAITSSIWLNLINSEKASPPFFEIFMLYITFLVHRMFLIRKEQNKPTN